ncbi:MAG: hypothetical protein HYS13_04975 [Planctomycetia bacterium]|nr:hypothetical protein [Planctomycetia bacterium]
MVARSRKSTWLGWLFGALLPGTITLGVIGCDSESRSSGQPAMTLGQLSDEDVPQAAAGSLTDDLVGKTLTVDGEIVQQCPSVGCWFRLKDGTGELFVDLNPAGLRLKDKRVGQQARVTGRLAKIGKQFRLEARFVEFEPKPTTSPPESQNARGGTP